MKSTLIIKTILSFLFALFFIFLPLIVSGDYDWQQGWWYCIVVLIFTVISRVLGIRKNPDLARERASFLAAEGIKEWDKKLLPYIVYYLPMLAMVVIGLDHRFGWSASLPALMSGFAFGLGAGLFIGGYLISTWAFVENRFFSSVVRIQTDRGHTVCDSGPYRLVRHPGYLGGIFIWLATPLILGSLWGFIPAVALIALNIARTHLEDQTLQAELAGYTEYAQKVRFRLFRGIW
jgi:protein-S-isoprenylcysteine O-methyltransferase Ste14